MAQSLLLQGYWAGQLLPQVTIDAAAAGVLSTPVTGLLGMQVVTAQFVFLYGADGTSVKAYLQTSFDNGTTWVDVACFAVTTTAATRHFSVRSAIAVAANYTPTDATLTDNTIKDGLLGDRLRVKYTSVGTYSGATSLAVHAVVKGA